MGSKSKGSLPARQWNISGFFWGAPGQQHWGPDSAQDPARCCTHCLLALLDSEHHHWAPHIRANLCAPMAAEHREKTATCLAHSWAPARDVLIYAEQCQVTKTAFSVDSTSKFNIIQHGCALGPMSIQWNQVYSCTTRLTSAAGSGVISSPER